MRLVEALLLPGLRDGTYYALLPIGDGHHCWIRVMSDGRVRVRMRTNREEWHAWTCDVEDLVKEVRLVRADTIPTGGFGLPAGEPPVPQAPPVTPGENGCRCHGPFSRSHNPARGCPIHGKTP